MSTLVAGSDASPWKQRFRAPLILSAQLATARPTRGLVVTNQQSPVFQLYAWDVASGGLRQCTTRPHGVFEGWIAPDGQHIYYLDDHAGNELGHVVRVPFEGGPADDMTPDLPPYTLRGVGWSRDGSRMAFNPINADGFQLRVITLHADGTCGPPDLIHQSDHEAWGALLSYDGNIATMYSTARAGGQRRYSLLAFDTGSAEQIGEIWDGPEASVEAELFSPVAGDERVLAITSRTGFRRPLVWNPRSGERIDLVLDDLDGEVLPFDWSPDGQHLLLGHLHHAEQHLYTYHLRDQTLTRLQHPGGTFYVPDVTKPAFASPERIVATWEDSAHPPRVVALDARTGAVERTLRAGGDVPPGHAWRSIQFTAADGQQIQGWLGLPDGDGPFPTILELHGGPHFVMANIFHPSSQAWLDHGYAFLSINYRGSTTFGRTFKEQIWGNIGHWELEDMAAARRWLVEQGIAPPDAVVLHGGSYGGYLTLLGLGKQPDLWAGGIALVAIADLTINYEDASDALKGLFKALLGGTPDEQPDRYHASSPITYADKFRAPLLVIQGRNDTRTTARQMEVFEQTLRALHKPIEVEWFDAGHGLLDVEQTIRLQERMFKFAERVLHAHTGAPSD